MDNPWVFYHQKIQYIKTTFYIWDDSVEKGFPGLWWGHYKDEIPATGRCDAIAELDFSLITKRKRMMDSVGHYSCPDLLQLKVNKDRRSVWYQTEIHQFKISEIEHSTEDDSVNGKPVPAFRQTHLHQNDT